MWYLVLVGAAAALFAGFLLMTRYEAGRGARFFENQRGALDKRVERALFVLTHVDFEAFVREEARVLGAHIAHDIAHLSLLFVRSAERLLTRLVRHLRVEHGVAPSTTAAPRAFVKTMRDFKEQLASTRPPIPEV